MSLDEAIEIVKEEYIVIPKITKPQVLRENTVLDVVTAIICQEYGFTLDEIKSRSRAGNLPRARYRIFYLTRRIFPEVGIRSMGRRFNLSETNAHSNVIHGINQMTGEINVTPKTKTEMELLEKRVLEELAK